MSSVPRAYRRWGRGPLAMVLGMLTVVSGAPPVGPGGAVHAQESRARRVQTEGSRADSGISGGSRTIQALGEELDSLVPMARELAGRADRADYRRNLLRLREAQIPADTFRYGAFWIISVPDQRGLAEKVFDVVEEELGLFLAGAGDLVAGDTFVVHYAWPGNDLVLEGDLVWLDMSRRYPLLYLERKAVEQVGKTLMEGTPQEVRDWSGGRPRAEPGRLRWVVRELVASASVAARSCYRGDLHSCAEALALNGAEGGWDRWYTPGERRLNVERMGRPLDGREEALWEECVPAERDEACDLILRDRYPVIPLSAEARASFLGHAMEIGGPGAFRRLAGMQEGTILQRLQAATGAPADSLLSSWRRGVLDARVSAWAGLARTPTALFFWVVLFGFLATRSTRWRLG